MELLESQKSSFSIFPVLKGLTKCSQHSHKANIANLHPTASNACKNRLQTSKTYSLFHQESSLQFLFVLVMHYTHRFFFEITTPGFSNFLREFFYTYKLVTSYTQTLTKSNKKKGFKINLQDSHYSLTLKLVGQVLHVKKSNQPKTSRRECHSEFSKTQKFTIFQSFITMSVVELLLCKVIGFLSLACNSAKH